MSSAERVTAERELAATFGERLRALRTARGLTQRDLAGEGLSSSYLSRLESGQRTPTPKVVDQLASRLGVPAEAFAGLGNGTKVTGGGFLAGAARVIDHLLAGRTEAALTVLDELRVDARDPHAKWLCEYAAAACANRLGRTQDVFRRLGALEPMYRGLPTAARVITSNLHTMSARELGRLREAIEFGQRSVAEADALATATGFPASHAALLRVRTRTALAPAYNAAGRLAEAFEACEQSLALVDEYAKLCEQEGRRDPLVDELVVVSRWMYARTLAFDAQLDPAGRHFAEALRPSAEAIGTELWCRVRLGAVSLFLELGVPVDGSPESLLNEVSQVRHSSRGQLDAQISTLRAELAVRSGDAGAALQHAQAALDSAMLGTSDRIRTLMTVVRVSTDLDMEERRLVALDELLRYLDQADPDEVRPGLLKEVAALSVRTLRNQQSRVAN